MARVGFNIVNDEDLGGMAQIRMDGIGQSWCSGYMWLRGIGGSWWNLDMVKPKMTF
jgi:hypothetical protein